MLPLVFLHDEVLWELIDKMKDILHLFKKIWHVDFEKEEYRTKYSTFCAYQKLESRLHKKFFHAINRCPLSNKFFFLFCEIWSRAEASINARVSDIFTK